MITIAFLVPNVKHLRNLNKLVKITAIYSMRDKGYKHDLTDDLTALNVLF